MRKLPLAGLALLLIAVLSCGDDDEGPTGPSGPSGPTTGSILVSLVMSGPDRDADGCTVAVDSGSTQQVNAGATAAFSGLSAGPHEVAIADVAANCWVEGSTSRSVIVVAGEVARDTFEVVCDWRTRIAFSRRTSSGYDIYSMNPDGTEEIQLTSDQEESWGPEWSPEGTRIAFERGQPYGKDDSDYMDIYAMNADGTEQVRLTTFSGAYGPTWSPDGSRIAFAHDRDIYVMNPDGTGEANLTNTADGEYGAAWSPGGSRIAYVCYEVQLYEYHICTMSSDGTGQVRLSVGSSPTWSPDGSRIAFWQDKDIHAMNADGTGQVNLTDHPDDEYDPTWSPSLY